MGAERTFGKMVKERRSVLGLTQDELARRSGCTLSAIQKIENGDLRALAHIVERLVMSLDVPLADRAGLMELARIESARPTDGSLTPGPDLEEIGGADLSGYVIRGYALKDRIGSGGMGAVYRAIQPGVEREVAIKIILPEFANHPDFFRRFESEAQLVARLEHPNIVPLYDYWSEPGVAYLVMRLMRGGSLQTLQQKGVMAPADVLRIMEQVGAALGAAHRAGVVHRDLKPANVLLDEDNNAYLADFGIAKNLNNTTFETQTGAIMGSPNYISPEQVRSDPVSSRTDIYALGVMLYELLTGSLPFTGPTPIEVMVRHLNEPLPPLAANRAGLPPALDAVVARATAKDPLQRYKHVDDMMNELRAALKVDRAVALDRMTLPEVRITTSINIDHQNVHMERVGSPIWTPVDFHIFAAPVGTFDNDYVEFNSIRATFLYPNHLPHPQLGSGPGIPHLPPYDSEIAQAVIRAGFQEGPYFGKHEFSKGIGVWLSWMVVPTPAVQGASPDFASGPVIPNRLFPIHHEGKVFQNGKFFSFAATFDVPALDDRLSPSFAVEGHSHFPVFLATNADFGPRNCKIDGEYEYRVVATDIESSGWKISVRFSVIDDR